MEIIAHKQSGWNYVYGDYTYCYISTSYYQLVLIFIL